MTKPSVFSSTLYLLLIFLISILSGCGNPPHPETFTVMTYNLNRERPSNHDTNSRMKGPGPEQNAVIQVIVNANPDILAVQGIGSPAVFKKFQHALSENGLTYPYSEYLQGNGPNLNMAVLSRPEIISRQSHKKDVYRIGKTRASVLRGFIDIDIQVNPDYQFRLFTCHLKSKTFHRLGQNEMRRNEARLLGKHIRKALKENPNANILVVGNMNDHYNSAILRELTGNKQEYLSALRPVDQAGDAWTYFNSVFDQYSRTDYALVSRGMRPEMISSNSVIVTDINTGTASDHRPLLITFRAKNTHS